MLFASHILYFFPAISHIFLERAHLLLGILQNTSEYVCSKLATKDRDYWKETKTNSK